MKLRSVGLDIVEIARFRAVLKKKKMKFILNTFSQNEQDYCFSYKDPAPHLAGTFAAKEAVQKATNLFDLSPLSLEIRRMKDNRPVVWIKNKLCKTVMISISHEKNLACAVAIYQK